MALWVLLQVTCIATFKIPSDSMEPALLPGDNILVNKWVMGARIFNIWDAAEGKEVKISRLPALGKIKGMTCWSSISLILPNGTVSD